MKPEDFGWASIEGVDPKIYKRAVIGNVPESALPQGTIRLAEPKAYPVPYSFPFVENGWVNEVVVYQALERVNDQIAFWKELYRICAHGAWVRLTSVYHSHIDAIADPTRKNRISERYFGYLSSAGRAQLRRDPFEDEIGCDIYGGVDFETKTIRHILEPEWEGFSDATRYEGLKRDMNVASRIEVHLLAFKPARKEE